MRFTSWHQCTQCGFEGPAEAFALDDAEVFGTTPLCSDGGACWNRWMASYKAKRSARSRA